MPSVFYFELEYTAPEDDWSEATGLIDNSDKVYRLLEELHPSAVTTQMRSANNPRIKYFVKNKRAAEQLLNKVEDVLDRFGCEILEIDF